MNLEGKFALITGGSRGIGRAICKRLAADKAHVIINYSSSAGPASELEKEIISSGGSAEIFHFDVSDENAVNDAIKSLTSKHGRLDILVNNAGIALDNLLMRTKFEEWDKTLKVNLYGCFYCSRAVSRSMLKSHWGRIINISSVIGESGNAGQSAYAASKAGLIGFTKSLAKELGGRNITVNAITPGYIETDMTSALSPEQTQQVLSQVPLNRMGKPEDVAAAVSFLAAESGSYITGHVLSVNGGLYM